MPAVKTLIFLVLVVACSPVKVLQTKSADSFNLNNYRTFSFYPVEASGDTIPERFMESVELLQNNLASGLRMKGLRRSDQSPDLMVNLGLVVENKVQTRQSDIRTDAPRYIGQRRYSWKSEEIKVNEYREGTVTVDLVDNDRQILVWQGVAEGVIPENLQQLDKTIAKGVDKLVDKMNDELEVNVAP
jgi:hypothetical protein